jgi:hypothetical protein
MHKESSRRRLGDTIEDETEQTETETETEADTESSPLSTRIMKQTSFCLSRGGTESRLGSDGDKKAAWQGIGVKHSSLSSLPRQTNFEKLREDEELKKPQLLKQSPLPSIPTGVLCDAKKLIGRRPEHPSRTQRSCMSRISPKPTHRPKLTFRKDASDETTDTLASVPRLVQQTSFTSARLSPRGPLLGGDKNGLKGSDKRQHLAKQMSLTMPKRWSLTHDSKDQIDEKTDTLPAIPPLVKQVSLTGGRLSSRGPFLGDHEKVGNRRERISLTLPRRSTRFLYCKNKMDEKTDTLSSIGKQTSLTDAGLSSRGLLIDDDDENGAKGSDRRQRMAKQNSLPILRRRNLTCDSNGDGKIDEKIDTFTTMPRLVKQISLTSARLSSPGSLSGNAEVEGSGPDRRERMAKQNSLTLPRSSTRSLYSKDKMDEMTDTLSSTLRLVEQAKHLKTQVSDSDVRRGRWTLTFDCEDESAARRFRPRFLTVFSMGLVWRKKHPSRS